MIKIKLMGELSSQFIDEFEADVRSASDVLSCLVANFPDFTQYLVDSTARGIGFYLKAGYQDLEESDLAKPFSAKINSFTLTPVPTGSGGGFGKILLGVALIGAGLLIPGGFLGLSSSTLLLTGGAMVLSGVSSLFGQTKAPNDEKNKKSLVFSGGATVVTEGSRLPIIFGRHRCGLFVLSAKVTSYAY